MASGKPLSAEYDRKVERFLDRAASVILENRTLAPESYAELVALAAREGLTEGELRDELADLADRGVIDQGIPAAIESPAPAPQPAKPAAAKSGDKATASTVSGSQRAAGSPPGASPPPKPHAATDPLRDRPPADRSAQTDPTASEPPSPPPARPPASRPPSVPPSSPPPAVTPTTPGSSPELVPPPGPSDFDESGIDFVEGPRRGLPPDCPQPPRRTRALPFDEFREFVTRLIGESKLSSLSQSAEQKLINAGIRDFGLATVLARHIIRDTAADLGLTVVQPEPIDVSLTAETKDDWSDDRFREFFDRVAPIVSLHRGINSKSRLLMSAVAQELGLGDDELQRAIASLQMDKGRGAELSDYRQLERVESYRAYLRRTLAKLPAGIITPRTEGILAEAGQLFHGVESEMIKQTTTEVAIEMGMRFVSAEQATLHVSSVVKKQLTRSPWLHGATKARVYLEGDQWGLTPMEVDSIIRSETDASFRFRSRFRRRSRWVLTLAALGLTGCVALFIWMYIDAQLRRADDGAPANVEPRRNARSQVGLDDDWWTTELQVAVSRVRTDQPKLRGLLDQVRRADVDRGVTYAEIVQRVESLTLSDDARKRCQRMLGGFIAHEPNEVQAGILIDAILRCIPAQDRPLAAPAEMENSLWHVDTLLSVLQVSTANLERNNQIVQRLNETLGATLSIGTDLSSVKLLGRTAACRHLYEVLTRHATADPLAVNDLHLALSHLALGHLDADTIVSLDTKLLAAVLPAVGSDWRSYRELLESCIDSSNPHVVNDLLSVYERLDNPPLQGYMAELFLKRVGTSRRPLTIQDVVRTVRDELGVAQDPTGAERRQAFLQSAAAILSVPTPDVARPDLILAQTIRMAHLSTQAASLTGDQAGFVHYDRLVKDPPKGLTRPKPSVAVPVERPNRTATDNLNKLAQSLAVARFPAERQTYLRSIAASDLEQIDPRAAAILAQYLLSPKLDGEYDRIAEFTSRLRRWNELHLAIADELNATSFGDARVRELVADFLGRDVSAEMTPVEARLALMESATGRMFGRSTGVTSSCYDEASASLRDSYALQARLAGAEVIDTLETGVAESIRRLIEREAARPLARPVDQGVPRRRASVPYQFQAIQYAGRNDLELTVMLQRMWLRLLADRVPARRQETDRIIKRLEAADRNPVDILTQLRDGEAAILTMWTLLSENHEL